MAPCNPSPYVSLLIAARDALVRYGQCLERLESRCLRPLFSCLGSVAIASALLVNAYPARSAESGVLSFDLGADASGVEVALTGIGGSHSGTLSGALNDQDGSTASSADLEAADIFDAREIVVSSADGGFSAIAQSQADRAWSGSDDEDDRWLDDIISNSASPSGNAAASHSSPKRERQEVTLSLGLTEPALVASAPFALADSVRRLGRAITPHQSVGESVAGAAPSAADKRKASLPSSEVIPEAWWHQGEQSPIAVAIGNAEGTRYADGGKTDAYYWHADPGNGANNFGTFSYQHLPHSLTQGVQRQPTTAGKREVAAQNQLPEISDRAQMKRLRRFHDQLQRQAAERGLVMGQLELLNALDLANQSEAAALWQEGYVDRLAELREYGGELEEQILQARAWSYWNPERKDWDAPGLGNTYETIRRDQLRRMEAIQDAMQRYVPDSAKLDIAEPVAMTKRESAAQDSHPGAFDVAAVAVGDGVSGGVFDSVSGSAEADAALADEARASQIILFDLL